jgi:crotonobetainyl-CoA hydratase
MDIALTSRVVSAREALTLGFVADVVADSELTAAALARAEAITQLAPLAVRGSRESVLRAMEQPTLAEAMRAQLHHPSVERNTASQDFKEGPLAFSEKRPPDWKGR